MSKNSSKIREAIRVLAAQPAEVRSGMVVAGSLDEGAHTVSVLPTGSTNAIKGVRLNSTLNNSQGVIIIPEEDSDVVIASIDGPGEWVVVKSGTVKKVLVTIGDVTIQISDTKVSIKNVGTELELTNSKLKLNTAAESLHGLLKDLIDQIALITVPSFGSVPANAPAFELLGFRLNNLLSS